MMPEAPPFVLTETLKARSKAYPRWLDFREGRVWFGFQGENPDPFLDMGWVAIAIFDEPRTGLEVVFAEAIR